MKRKDYNSKHWWRVLPMLLLCLLVGNSPTWAVTREFYNAYESNTVVHSPTLDEPYLAFHVMYYDATDGHNGFFMHQSPSGVPSGETAGPALFVDGNYICTPDYELAWPGGGNGNSNGATSACSDDDWWGETYTQTVDGVTYTVMFYDPYNENKAGISGSKRKVVTCLVFMDKVQLGKKYTVKIAGWWKINNTHDPLEQSYTWTFTGSDMGMSGLSAVMSEYGKMKISGNLLQGYGPTTVGSYVGATKEGLKWTDDLTSKESYSSDKSSFSNQEIVFSERNDYFNNATKYIEYIVPIKDFTPTGYKALNPKFSKINVYQWYPVSVPGYIRAKATPTAVENNKWKKEVKLTWVSEGNNTGGTWNIYRYKTSAGADTHELLTEASNLIYNTTSRIVTAPTYDEEYTYEISFIPINGVQRSELTASVKHTLARSWEFTSLAATVNDQNAIDLSWAHNSIGDATGSKPYTLIVQRSENYDINNPSAATWNDIKNFSITSSGTNKGSYTDNSGLIANRTYYYRLKINLLEADIYSSVKLVKLGGSKITAFSATRGTYSSMVKLEWNVKQAGSNITNFIVQRRPLGSNDETEWANIHKTAGTASGYSYDDVTALPGSYNEYKVIVWSQDGSVVSVDDAQTTDGFSLSMGSISGNITYGTGTAVESAKVVLKRQNTDGEITSGMRSVKLAGTGQGFKWNADTTALRNLFKDDFSIQLYINPDSTIMNGNKRYQLMDVSNSFTLYLSYDKTAHCYYPGVYMQGIDYKTALKVYPDEWVNIACVHNKGTQTTFYLVAGDSIRSEILTDKDTIVSVDPLIADVAKCMSFGNNASFNGKEYYNGYMDEFRFFTKALTERDIRMNYNHPLAGNEGGLAIYYPFDEGLKSQSLAYDFSKTNGISNGRHAVADVAAEGNTYIPSEEQLSLMAYTDVNGYYEVRGIPFSGEGTSYSVVPSLGIHEFSPSKRSRFVSMSSLNHSGVDFNDVSSFPVSGKIRYSNTDYPVEDVSFYIDGVMCSKDGVPVKTNKKGEFTISVPIGQHAITVAKSGHIFVNNGRYPADPHNTGEKFTFDREIKGLEFRDTTLVNFTGRVVGGSIEGNKAVGFALSENNIGKAEIVLTPKENYRLNVVKEPVNETTFSLENNPDSLPVISATDRIKSTSCRTGGLTQADCQKIVINTDPATGEFSAMLPPLVYDMQAIKLVKNKKELAPASMLDLTRVNITLSDTLYNEDGSIAKLYEYNTMLRQTYHAPASFIVRQQGREDGSFGIDSYKLTDDVGELVIDDIYSVSNGKVTYKYGAPLFIKSDPYTFLIKGFEEYTNVDNGFSTTVPLKGNIVTINNALSAVQSVYVEDGIVEGKQVVAGEVVELKENQLQLDDNGEATYKWIAGLPNIAEPYTRTINIDYDIDGRLTPWSGNGMTGIILGDLPTGNNFVTSGPDKPLMILRDPPGTGSSAEWSSGSSTTTSTLRGNTFTENFSLKFNHKFGLTTQTIVGTPGAGELIVADAKDELTAGATMESEGENSTTRSFTTSITKTITTSDAPEFVGDQGDVYIGASTNLIFGKARNVGFQRISSSDEAELGLEDILTTNIGFGTMFQYTRYYIENTLIPNYKEMRSNLLTTVADTASFVNNTNHVVYVTPLSANDEQYGENGTYKAMAPQVIPEGVVFEDSIVKINKNIENWENIIKMNERAKVRAYELRDVKDSVNYVNYSFDAGSTMSYSVETDSTTTHTWEWSVAAGIVAENTFGFELKGIGFECTMEDETTGGRHESDETETSNTSSFAFTLAEEGDDALSVDVYEYDAFGPIFRTRGGQTSAPYEGEVRTTYYVDPNSGEHPVIMEATMQIEVPQIDVDVPIMNDVPTGSAADYTLRLSNASEIGADVAYKLFMLDETNENGAQLSIDGKVLTEGRFIKVPGNQTLTKTLQLRQTNTSILDYDNIGIVFASESQPEEIADTVFISAHFVPSSSPVTLALSNTLVNTQTGSDLVLTFSNFDRNYRGLKAFRLQYKKQGSSDWSQIREYVLKSKDKTDSNYMLPSTGASVSYTLPMASFSDGNYLFRVESASTYGSDEVHRYSDEIAVVKDMMRPRPLGMPEPADGILDIGDELSITFNELFLKGDLTKEANFKITGVLNGAEVEHETALSMQSTETTAQTDADISLAGKDFSTDLWMNINGKGTILSHGTGADKFVVSIDNNSKLVVDIADKSYTSTQAIPKNKWVFLTLSYRNSISGGELNASVGAESETITLFNGKGVVKYAGSGPLAVGKNLKGAIHELLLWDEAHNMTTALMNRSKTKNPSTRHLIGYWKMNEGEGTTIRDYARNRHMTMPDETWYLNNENKAVSLTNNNYLKIKASDSSYSADDDFAVELWMRAEKQSGAAQILQAGEVSLWLDTQGQLQLTGKGAYLPDDNNEGYEAVTLATASGKLNNNAWHHIALNVLRKGAAAVYVDGERKLTTNASNVGSISTDNIFVGARRTTFSAQATDYAYDRHLNGQVDEIRIWDATLNADQLLANRKVRLTGHEDGLLYYYPFEKKTLDQYNQVVTIGTAEDLTGNGNNAVSTASALTYVDEAPALRTKPTETNVNFDFVASDTKVVIEIDEDPATIEGCTLNFTVRDVSDANGNYSMPTVWSAFVNRNELEWKDDQAFVTTTRGIAASYTATIVNKSGMQQLWTLSGMPAWLQADAEYGTTNPVGETDVTFTVSETTPVGKYEETIYLKGNNGIETPITISVRVTGEDPQWFVNASDYEGSMNVVGTIMFPAGPSNDAEDKLAAFIGDECRGVAQSKYNSRYDSYFVMLNVYGGPNDSGKEITFKAYDAATGVTYAVVSPSVNLNYSSNSVVGKNTDPVIFTAVDRLEQSQLLAAGWNWMSMYVKSDDMSVPTIFANIAEQTDMVKSKTLFMAHGAGKWYGNNIIMNNKEMYMAKMNEEQRLKVIGGKVDVTKEKIDIASGWNWIGYSGSRVISLTDALAELEAEDGDVIKSQRDFAMYDGYEWTGTLTALVPGEGYMYRSLASGTKSFHYPSAAVSGSGMRMPHRAPTNGDFDPIDHHLYPGNMNIIAQLYVNGSLAVNKELGVFQGSECRTSAVTDDSGYAFLTVPGESSCKLMFKVMGDDNKSMLSNERLDYVNDAIIGTLLNPYVVHINASDQVTGVAYLDGEVNVWPQRVENSVHVDSDRDIKQILIIDTAGQLVMSIEAPLGHENLINLSGCANGIYFVKVILSSGQPVVKRIVKG